jgi:hypothetical protein
VNLPIPLSITLRTSRIARRITAQVRDLSYRTVVPGGYASASISLDRPLAIQPDEIGYYGRMLIHDTRSGRIVWEGRVEDPGRSAGADGQVWDITAIGPSAHVHDRQVPVIYVDRDTGRWQHSNKYASGSSETGRTDLDDGDEPGLTISAPEGTTTPNGWIGDLLYQPLKGTGQSLARVAGTATNGANSPTTWFNEIVTRQSSPSGSPVTPVSSGWSTSPTALAATRGGSPAITSGHDLAYLRQRRDGSSGTAGDGAWVQWTDVVVLGQRMDASGALITTGYSGVSTVTAAQVIADLLGRLLPLYDGPGASIETAAFDIEQLAFPDPASPSDVLDDLMLFHPGFYWAAWEANSAGKYRFEWRSWPSTVRYEADVTDGMRSTGSADELFNQVTVRWRDVRGSIRTVMLSNPVPILTAAGLTRDGYVSLGDDLGMTVAQATQIGNQFLADHALPRNAGSLTIARPIYDGLTGRMAYPWEILPGHLIRVRGIQPRVDALNPTGRDGVSVFRVVAVSFSASDGVATLELDSHPPSVARSLADLHARRGY